MEKTACQIFKSNKHFSRSIDINNIDRWIFSPKAFGSSFYDSHVFGSHYLIPRYLVSRFLDTRYLDIQHFGMSFFRHLVPSQSICLSKLILWHFTSSISKLFSTPTQHLDDDTQLLITIMGSQLTLPYIQHIRLPASGVKIVKFWVQNYCEVVRHTVALLQAKQHHIRCSSVQCVFSPTTVHNG